VVTASVEPYAIVAGVPARAIGRRHDQLDYSTRYQRLFK
jgi:acetyltransferase-like isoleucine patch superfamily enzyme